MNKDEKLMRDFIAAELKNRELGQADLDRLAEVLYPHDGTNEGVLAATRKFTADVMAWGKKKQEQEKKQAPVEPMSDDEIEALAAML